MEGIQKKRDQDLNLFTIRDINIFLLVETLPSNSDIFIPSPKDTHHSTSKLSP